jgi:hypothetical protein
MNIYFILLILMLAISFVDCVTTELYFKPKWRKVAADGDTEGSAKWDNAYHFRTVVMFAMWYLVAINYSWELTLLCAVAHAGGWEDMLYAVWVPLFTTAKEAWKYEPGVHIGPWIFPYEWHWLGEYGGFWKFLGYNLLTLIGGKRVSLTGMLICMVLTLSVDVFLVEVVF